jgi:hypothetical protein
MPKLTIRKSGRAKKPSRNTQTHSESPPMIKPAKKRVKPAKFIHPDNMDVVDDIEEEEEAPMAPVAPPPPEDVSEVIFTIQKSCTFGGVVIVNDSDFVKPGQFDFRYFYQQALHKVAQAAIEGNCEYAFTSGQAIISQQAMKVSDYLSISVEDEFGWKKVELGVERWMREKKKSITVKVMLVYKKKGEVIPIVSDDEMAEVKKVSLK